MKPLALLAALGVLFGWEVWRQRRAPIVRPRSVWIVDEDEWRRVRHRPVVWSSDEWDKTQQTPLRQTSWSAPSRQRVA